MESIDCAAASFSSKKQSPHKPSKPICVTSHHAYTDSKVSQQFRPPPHTDKTFTTRVLTEYRAPTRLSEKYNTPTGKRYPSPRNAIHPSRNDTHPSRSSSPLRETIHTHREAILPNTAPSPITLASHNCRSPRNPALPSIFLMENINCNII